MNSTDVVKFDVDNATLFCCLTNLEGFVVHRMCSLPCLTSCDPVKYETFVVPSLDVGMPARNLSPHYPSDRLVV